MLSLAKVQMLERRGGERNRRVEAQHNSRTTSVPLCVYSILCNQDSGLDGAEDIADYRLQIASSDGFYWNFGSIWNVVISKSFQSKFEWLLVELGQYIGNKEVIAWGAGIVSFCRDRGFSQ